jgi:hypothetical protein
MKYLIPILFGFLFALACINATAQTVTFDTLYFERVNGQLYQITRTEFDNGSYSQTRYAADSLGVLRVYADEIEREGNALAESARAAVKLPQYVNESIRRQNILNTSLGVRPIIDIQQRHEAQFLQTATSTVWQLGNQTVTFGKTGTGQLTFKVGSDAAKPAILLGQVIRLNNFPATGQSVVLFQLRPNVWQDIDDVYQLRRVNLQAR